MKPDKKEQKLAKINAKGPKIKSLIIYQNIFFFV